jgi:uncharacterized protein with beta-barrel porin domain
MLRIACRWLHRSIRVTCQLSDSLRHRMLRRAFFGAVAATACWGATALVPNVALGQVVLSGDYMQMQVNDVGGMLGGPIRLAYDSTGSGNFGSPTHQWFPYFDAFGLEYGVGNSARSEEGTLYGFDSHTGASLRAPGSGGFDQSATWTGMISGVLDLNHVYAMNTGDKRVQVTTTITATGNVSNVKFVHKFLPFDAFSNSNQRGNSTLGYSTSDFVSAQATGAGPVVAYFTDSAVTHNSGIVFYADYDPDSYLNATTDTATSIDAIGLGFDVGDLLLGESIVLVYWIAVGDDPNDFLFATVSDLAARGATINQIAVGSYFDSQSGSTDPDLQDVITQLNSQSDADLQASLDSLSGAVYGSLSAANVQHTSYYLSQIATRLRNRVMPSNSASSGGITSLNRSSPTQGSSSSGSELDLVSYQKSGKQTSSSGGGSSTSAPIVPMAGGMVSQYNAAGWTGWITGYGLGGTANSDGNADGFAYGLGGTQFAVEKPLDEYTTAGIWGNLAWSNIQGQTLNENANMENYHFGGHFTSATDDDYWLGIAGAGYDHYQVRRQLNVLAPVQAEGTMGGWQANAYLERGLLTYVDQWDVQPYVALQYIYLHQGELVEQGAGVLNLDIEDVDSHSLRGILGARFSQTVLTSGGRLVTPEVRAAWIHEFLDTNQVINAGLAGVGGAGFAVRGVDLGRDWATVGGGASLHLSESTRLFGGYDLQVNGNQAFHIGSGGVECLW